MASPAENHTSLFAVTIGAGVGRQFSCALKGAARVRAIVKRINCLAASTRRIARPPGSSVLQMLCHGKAGVECRMIGLFRAGLSEDSIGAPPPGCSRTGGDYPLFPRAFRGRSLHRLALVQGSAVRGGVFETAL